MPEGHSVHRITRQFERNFVGHVVHASSPQGRFAEGAADLVQLAMKREPQRRDLKLKPSVTMRPDVHCSEWRRHGSVFLALWRAETYDARVGRPSSRNVCPTTSKQRGVPSAPGPRNWKV